MITDMAGASAPPQWRGMALLVAMLAPSTAFAQAAPGGATLPGVVIVAPTPFPANPFDTGRIPTAVTTLRAEDLARGRPPDMLRALDEQVAGVQLVAASGDAEQPTLFYRGFQASPLQGAGQGLAVYVGGVRANQPFGDTVDWDLIPSAAIDRLTLTGSSPAFGLNALAGALNVQMKSAFTWQGGEAVLSGGSFGKVEGEVQVGWTRGEGGLYLAASARRSDGWRDLQSTDVSNLFGDLGWRRGSSELHLDLRLARSDLNGPGASPVELLAADRTAQFTAPNAAKNGFAGLSLAWRYAPGPNASLQAVLHLDDFRQQVANGNAPNDGPCADFPSLLCADGLTSTTLGGQPIPALLGPDPLAYAELDRQTTRTTGYGAAFQATDTARLMGRPHHVLVGLSFDGADTTFDGVSIIGGIDPRNRLFRGPGVVIDEPGVSAPVRIDVRDAYAGVFASDVWDASERLSITLSGRLNLARIDLKDRNGGDLGGRHRYDRLNPAAGAAWRAGPRMSLYVGYAEANRAPTPAELSCANPADACSLANFFVGDPALKQVVARTIEAGARGALAVGSKVTLNFDLGFYRSELQDDIAFVNSTTLGRAYFANIGRTRRQGVDLSLVLEAPRWRAYLDYSHVEATYRGSFVEAAGQNPAAGPSGVLTVRPGDRLPGVPANQVKLGVRVEASQALSLGLAAEGRDGAVLFGDEANLTPKLPGYLVVNLDATYRLTPHLELFGRVENLADARYATFGTFSPTSAVRLLPAPGARDPRSLSPAAPIGGDAGLRLRF
jgi:iron complex outermembrane recepter protein